MRRSEQDHRFYLSREPVILSALLVLVVLFFVAVTGISHVFFRQQDSLGVRWFARGTRDLSEARYKPAVASFRTALLYSRDNFSYQLKLAEALVGQRRFTEASAYLVNLWEQQPDNGVVNLELARINVQQDKSGQALRYYHNAIYSTWPSDEEVRRRETRVELIRYLLGSGDRVQAQSELIALAANLGKDPKQHLQAADLFYAAQDYEHALSEYSLVLKSRSRDAAALAGAGRSSFQLQHYGPAESYLKSALDVKSGDAALAEMLKKTQLILRMDPYQRRLSFAQRSARVQEAFALAGKRLKACPDALAPLVNGVPAPLLLQRWKKLRPQITDRGLRRNPELTETAMELVFEIERKTQATCSAPSPEDQALLQIAQVHQGS
jgi:tetratricopeptide (TPR) repeat protein